MKKELEGSILTGFDLWEWCDENHFEVSGNADARSLKFARVSTDTRSIQTGDLFVALVGERFDAHDFLRGAWESGAKAAIVSRPRASLQNVPDEMILIHVQDTLAALQMLATSLWREMIVSRDVITVSLTGSNGKTTSKELLRALFSVRHAHVYATHGNFNNHIGVPLTICAIPLRAEVVILEMGASKRGDIDELTAIAPARARLITSIGHAHLEGMGGLDGVRLTKREIFHGHDAHTIAVVPKSEQANLITSDYQGVVKSFCEGCDEANVSTHIIEEEADGTLVEVRCASLDALVRFKLPLLGAHHVSNIAGCLAIASELGEAIDEEWLRKAMEKLHIPGGRSEVVELGGYRILNDSYNANPTSMLASFEAFLSWSVHQRGEGDELIAIIGEMAEVGQDAKNWHEQIACRMVEVEREDPRQHLTALICVGRHAQGMKQATSAIATSVEVVACEDLEEVARWLTKHERGVIFLKASRSARLERLMEIIQDG